MVEAYLEIKMKKMAAPHRPRSLNQNNPFSFVLDEKTFLQLAAILENLDDIEQKQVVIKTLRNAATTIKLAGRHEFKKSNKSQSGNLYKSFTTSLKRRKLAHKSASYAGFKRNANKKKNNGGIASGNHAHLIDRGTAKRWRYKSKKGYTGSVSKNNPNKGSMFWTKTVFTEGPRLMQRVTDTVINILIKNGFR